MLVQSYLPGVSMKDLESVMRHGPCCKFRTFVMGTLGLAPLSKAILPRRCRHDAELLSSKGNVNLWCC